MTREEFIQKYCYEWTERGYEGKPILIEQMKADLDKLPLPPAEGAAVAYYPLSAITDVLESEPPIPPAEGAEEILNKAKAGGIPLTWLITPEFPAWNAVVSAMNEFAALYAQKTADKMVSERLREELIKYDKYIGSRGWIDNYEDWAAITSVDEYLKSREQ